MPTSSNPAIGEKLRAHRERRGITLAALAESIKVKQTLLESLERSDLSRWPPGIYGRALVREYAKSIGLPPNETLEQLGDLFPEEDRREHRWRSTRSAAAESAPADMRLTLAGAPAPASPLLHVRLRAALIELAVLFVIAFALSRTGVLSFWTTTTVLALVWYPAAAIVCGHDTLYRKLRVPRLVTWRPLRAAAIGSATRRQVDVNTMPVSAPADSPADSSLLIEHDVNASSSASVH